MIEGKQFERLPKHVKPNHYKLFLLPDLESLTFQGDVSIQIEVLKSTDNIVFNAVDLKLSDVKITGNEEMTPSHVELYPEEETVSVKFSSFLPTGSYTLNIAFTGEINDKMKGLYRSKYVNEKGEEVFAAVTQFESTDARRCFPCWDEPALKATFDISLTIPKDLVALSNMPVRCSKQIGDLIRGINKPIMACIPCKIVNDNPGIKCGSSERSVHIDTECSGLNASEKKIMDLRGKRTQKLYCVDCQNGVGTIPKLIGKIDNLEGDLKKLSDQVAKLNHNANESQFDDILTEISEQNLRKNNLMVFNMPEQLQDQ
ncbi:hypothetical protein JTB14_027295 [Gonioctena quinquepunctata]|nr:hypothetical protein JTB14_027295 [Gonioctena quinquepunctata]